MKKTKSNFKLFFSMMVLTLLFSSNAFSANGKIVLTNKVLKQVIKKDKDGNVTYSYIEPKTALPGDVMMYVISFENIGKDPAKGIVINDPLPNNSKYRMGSAAGKNTKITFSIDDGNNFGHPEDLVVKDINGKEWTAKPESYTHIRWVYNKPLAPGEKSEVSFKTQIKDNE
ncbi:MAG: DUF11 domain-containing protein [Gammaproteobacteria bacterium]|nr:DUF11 domain-containing protein [Gammaproteobacteria bacterium]